LPEPAARPANVIVILADDLGWSDLGCYGGEINTPHLDRLAGGGMRFTRFYNTAKCYTTRASLLTGVYQHEAGIGGLISRGDRPLTTGPYQGYLEPAVPTVPEMLKAAGYRSYHSGKWHVGERAQHWPIKRGFDRSFALISGATSYYEVIQEDGRLRVMTRDDVVWTPPREGFYATNAYTEAALEFLNEHARSHGDAPFFLYLAYTAPHWPLHAPEERIQPYLARYSAGWDQIRDARVARQKAMGLIARDMQPSARPSTIPAWEAIDNKALWARRMATYAAMIEIMDEGIGRVLDAVTQQGQIDNTLILFLSDNGASHEDISARKLDQPGSVVGDRRSFQNIEAPWAWAANAPLRGTKETVFEGGINTPCIAHWPGKITPGAFNGAPHHVVDIAPTALALAGLDSALRPANAPAFRGIDLQSAFAGRTIPRGDLFFEIFGSNASIDGRWKLAQHKGQAGWSLFDVVADPGERIDLATQAPERAAAMRERWLRTARDIGVRGV
jgi:arylsulfatase